MPRPPMRLSPLASALIAESLAIWFPAAVAASGCAMISYGAMQQTLRADANDPQVAMAEDAADALASGSPVPAQPASTTDAAVSLSPFIEYFDASGAPVSSSGLLDGQMPEPPRGILEAAKGTGENRVTWQPFPDVRIAAVAVAVAPGKDAAYVLAGRSLREAEKRIDAIGRDILFGWGVTVLATFVAALLATARRRA